MPLGGDARQEADEGFGAAAWGSAEYFGMGEPGGDEVEWEGGMMSLHLGADMRVHRDFLAGMSASRSSGDYDFTDVTGARNVAGTYEARLNSVNPYLAWLPGRKGVAVWAAGSFGWGEVAVDDGFAGRRQSDTRTTTGAVGASRILVANGASALRVRTEGWLSRVKVGESDGMDSLTLDMQRGRLALEWSQVHKFRSGDEVTVLLEGGARFGSGEGTDGAGMEFGGGVRYASPATGLTMEGRGRLLATGDSGYEEWGVGGMIQIDPQAGRGLSMRLVPAWGEDASGVQELWERGVSSGRDPAAGKRIRPGRLNAEGRVRAGRIPRDTLRPRSPRGWRAEGLWDRNAVRGRPGVRPDGRGHAHRERGRTGPPRTRPEGSLEVLRPGGPAATRTDAVGEPGGGGRRIRAFPPPEVRSCLEELHLSTWFRR